MPVIFALFAIAAGVGSALQAGSNQMLQKSLAVPLWTVTIVSAITFIVALPIQFFAGERWPSGSTLAQAPWWSWTGGLFGLGFVLATVFVSPKLGAGLFVGLVVTASTITSLLLDHYGWIGFDVHPAGAGRIAGGVLMILGIALIAAF